MQANSTFFTKLRTAFAGAWGTAFANKTWGDNAGRAIDYAIQNSAFGFVPIGAIIAWTSNIAGTPALPANFKKCDGTAINNALSPMNGQSVPNLNAGAGGNSFLRGNSTSGTFNTANLGQHTHLANGAQGGASGNMTLPNHAHSAVIALFTTGSGNNGLTSTVSGGTGTTAGPTTAPAIPGSTSGPSGGDASTRIEPASMDVMWVMRIY